VQSNRVLQGHRQEVCGLKWSPDGQSLASALDIAGADVLRARGRCEGHRVVAAPARPAGVGRRDRRPVHSLLEHTHLAANAMRRHRYVLRARAAVKAIAWSPHQHGLLASGGGTADRCIRFWNTLTSQPMQCVAKLTGHSYRVLYLALSPDGEAIVTGAGDETLRFWNVFSKTPSHKENKSVLNLYTTLR
ncbi:Fizzy-related protein, partial [Operophtera brumata]